MTLSGPFKTLLALCALAVLCLGVSACGTTSKPTRSSATSTPTATLEEEKTADPDKDHDSANPDEDDHGKPPPPDRDKDKDATGTGRYDSDDHSVLSFGYAASAADTKAISTLIKRYYAAANAEDGAQACSMLYSTYAESVPEDYGTSPPGPPYARGKTCAAVMTLYFKHFHNEIAARFPQLKVYRVRVRERQGLVITSAGELPEREIHVIREGHTWRVVGLIDNELQ